MNTVFVEERGISIADGGGVWIAMDMGAGRCRRLRASALEQALKKFMMHGLQVALNPGERAVWLPY